MYCQWKEYMHCNMWRPKLDLFIVLVIVLKYIITLHVYHVYILLLYNIDAENLNM